MSPLKKFSCLWTQNNLVPKFHPAINIHVVILLHFQLKIILHPRSMRFFNSEFFTHLIYFHIKILSISNSFSLLPTSHDETVLSSWRCKNSKVFFFLHILRVYAFAFHITMQRYDPCVSQISNQNRFNSWCSDHKCFTLISTVWSLLCEKFLNSLCSL